MYSNDSADFANGFIAGQNGSRNDCGNGMWGGDGSWWIVIILFALIFGWNGNNGWGNGNNAGAQFIPYAIGANGALTRSDLCAEFNFNGLENAVRGVQQGICDSTYALNTSILNGFHGVDNAVCNLGYQGAQLANQTNVAIMQGFNGVDRSVCALGYNMQSGFNATQAAIQSCCCDVRAGLKDIQFQNATDTCAIQTAIASATRDITDNANANYRGLMDFMVQSKIDSLQNENQALRLSASQAAQNSVLMAAMDANKAEILRKTGAECPMPAYVVQPPQPVTFPTNCCGTVNYAGYGNNGCVCNSGCGC